jgi:ferrous iron transport protein B
MDLLKRIDTLILNRIIGIPLFLGVMYGMFLFSIQVGGPIQSLFDEFSQYLFIQKMEQGLLFFEAPQWLIGILAHGVGQGINTTFTFIPVISCLFFCLSFLEMSGVMARVAVVMDKLMQWFGLPGKSFVPMIIGFGCNVPAIVSARTLENRRERILTIMMSPFMSCGARLAIFALFVSAFFPEQGQNVIFGLYLIGIIVAVLTGLVLKKTILLESSSVLSSNALPPYQWPRFKTLGKATMHRSKSFVRKAGLIIVPVCAVMGLLGAVHTDTSTDTKSTSLIATIGKSITPLFAPMGIQEENWPATVGLVTGILAKEVVVGTLNTLYTDHSDSTHLENHMSESTMGIMVQKFGSSAAAFAYLLFVLLYFPCVSVVAAMTKELHKGWALFSVVWTTGIAYIVAVFFYQSVTMMEHPLSSGLWLTGLLCFLALSFWGIRIFGAVSNIRAKKRYPLPTVICVAQ